MTTIRALAFRQRTVLAAFATALALALILLTTPSRPVAADPCPSGPVPMVTPEPCTPPPGHFAYLPVVARPGIRSIPATAVYPGP